MSDDTEAREAVLSHCEPWVREYVTEHGQLPPGLMFRLPFVETLLIEARAQALEAAARVAEQHIEHDGVAVVELATAFPDARSKTARKIAAAIRALSLPDRIEG